MKKSILSTAFFTLFALSPFSVGEVDVQSLTASCVACHGNEGVANSPIWPNLAGQKQQYLANELKAFRDGKRNDPSMAANVNGLSDETINAIAAHYAQLSPSSSEASTELSQAGLNVRGRCISCHGIHGITVNTEWPNLAGQNSAYLEKQLLAFKSDARQGGLMNVIAKELSDQEIKDVSDYYSQITP